MSKIFIVGFMGVGKTTFGKKLAKKLNYDFIDTDKYIVNQQAKSIAQLFDQHGEKYFRQIEEQTLKDLVKGNDKIVISTGGGMGANISNMELMKNQGTVIYLQLDKQSIYNRLIQAKAKRPLIVNLNDNELLRFIEDRLKEREPVYSMAHITLNALNIKSIDYYTLNELIINKTNC